MLGITGIYVRISSQDTEPVYRGSSMSIDRGDYMVCIIHRIAIADRYRNKVWFCCSAGDIPFHLLPLG